MAERPVFGSELDAITLDGSLVRDALEPLIHSSLVRVTCTDVAAYELFAGISKDIKDFPIGANDDSIRV
jgi:hypothetical protein